MIGLKLDTIFLRSASPSTNNNIMIPSASLSMSSFCASAMNIFIVSTITILIIQIQPTNAFSAINRSSNAVLLSRLQTIQAELLVSIGRIPGTAMPPEWTASGAKLGFALEVEFTNEPPNEYEMTKERLLKGDALMGSTLYSVEPLNIPSFVSTNGKEEIKVESGAYGCQIQGLESRQYAFRFFMDFPQGAKRNDVELPAERIYFLSSCWLLSASPSSGEIIGGDKSIERARKRQEGLLQSIQQITNEIDEIEQKSAESNFFQKAALFREQVNLVKRCEKLSAQLADMEQTYPLDSSKVMQGPNGITFAKEGMVAVKRLRGAMGTKEQYHWVGTFTFNDFFEDEDEDDEEDE